MKDGRKWNVRQCGLRGTFSNTTYFQSLNQCLRSTSFEIRVVKQSSEHTEIDQLVAVNRYGTKRTHFAYEQICTIATIYD